MLLPYCFLTVPSASLSGEPKTLLMLLLVGVLHTGVTYYLYFGAMEFIPAQSVAVISYVDPVVAVLASVLILREPMALTEGIGAVLILGAAAASELEKKEE